MRYGTGQDTGVDAAFDEITLEPPDLMGRPTADMDPPFDVQIAVDSLGAKAVGFGELGILDEIGVVLGGETIGVKGQGSLDQFAAVGQREVQI